MSKEHPNNELQMVPINLIDVLNPRDRNSRVFDEIIGNIKTIGLKKPVTVTPRKDADGNERFLLICGEGRLKAFKSLGESTIPAMVVHVSDEDGFIMSLAENIARRQALLAQSESGSSQDEANPTGGMFGTDGGDRQHHCGLRPGAAGGNTEQYAGGRTKAKEDQGCYCRPDGTDGARNVKP